MNEKLHEGYEIEYPEFYGQCSNLIKDCIFNESPTYGYHGGCIHEELWTENGNQIHDDALEYQNGTKKCPYRK